MCIRDRPHIQKHQRDESPQAGCAHPAHHPSGSREKVLTYVGQRYGLRNKEDLFRVRIVAAVDVVLMTVILLLINFFPGTGGMVGLSLIHILW